MRIAYAVEGSTDPVLKRTWVEFSALLVSVPLLFVCFVAVFAYVVGFDLVRVYEADLVQGFLLAQDLLADPRALFEWYHSPAIYVVPDWILAAILVMVHVPDRLLPIAHGALLLTLLSYAGGALISASGKASVVAASWAIAALLVMFGLAAFSTGGAWITQGAFVALGTSVIHSGAVLMSVVAGALLVEQLQECSSRFRAFVFAATVFVSAFSDFSFVAWFAGPACVVILLHSRSRGSRNGIRTGTMIAVTAIAGVVLERLLRQGGGIAGYSHPVGPFASVAMLWEHLKQAWTLGDYALAVLAGLILALLCRSAILLLRALRKEPLSRPALIELFLGGSCAAGLLAPMVTGLYADITHWRYFLIVFLLPLLWVALVVFVGMESRRVAIGWAGAATVLVSSVAVSAGAVETIRRVQSPWPLEACLKEEGRTAGLSGYWPVKATMLMTSRRIHLVQINDVGDPYRWNYNGRWFSQRADDGTRVRPDFIVIENLKPELLRNRYGAPSQSITCGSTEIWLYDHPLDVFAPIDRVYSAAVLPAAAGSIEGTARVATENAPAGTFTFGPYIEAPAGEYEVRIRYSATGTGHTWDIAESGARTILAGGDLPGTDGAVRDLIVELISEHDLSALEVRTLYAGSGDLTLHEIGIRQK